MGSAVVGLVILMGLEVLVVTSELVVGVALETTL